MSAEVEMEQVPQPTRAISHDSEVGSDEKKSILEPSGSLGASLTQSEKSALHNEIGLRQLINKLNLLNFQGEFISVVFRHRIYQRTRTFKALPLPCQDARLVCRWETRIDIDNLRESFEFQCLYLTRGQQLYEVRAVLRSMDDQQATFDLPRVSREISERKSFRYPCSDISAYVFQNGATFFGHLVDYGAFQFRIVVNTVPPQTFRWIDKDDPVTVVFTKGQETLFSGECRITKQHQYKNERHLILEPMKRQVHRFRPREFRNQRQKLMPSPDVIFNHPLFETPVTLRVHDLSGSGFSVEEEKHTAVLLPGMIIPALDLIFGDGSTLRCIAQVVYSRYLSDSTTVRCGFAILDMSVKEHTQLLALLHQAGDANVYISKKVDMHALWDFFFETGFIYPQKYKFIEANKEAIKSTYEKLYNRNPSIASHFIYQDSGRILAHMAMVRFYDKAWLIHHHAAIRNGYQLAGLTILYQIAQFINDCHRFHSMNMDYAFCYFRPENKFPAHVFGGAARSIKNQNICSTDHFAYYHHNRSENDPIGLPKNWALTPVNDEDLRDLHHFYTKQSGGLMLQGLHLTAERIGCEDVIKAYQETAFKRDRQVLALKHRDRLCAVFMANHSDLGLNMSDLTNSITIIVVNQHDLTQDLLHLATKMVARLYAQEEIPILLFPKHIATQLELNCEKSYCLWIYQTQNLDPYFRYLKRFLKFARH